MYDGTLTIKSRLDTKEFDKQIASLTNKLNDMKSDLETSGLRPDSSEYIELQKQIEITENKLKSLINQKNQLAKDNLSNISNSVSSIIKKVGQWALAVFGVRSAYLAIRKAASTLSQYNDQIKSDLEYIQYAVATALQPAIEALISYAYKLLQYVNYIANAWFGINLFAGADKNFKKANGAAKELKKTLSGFDEMNVLSDNSSSSSSGGSAATDLSKLLKEQDVPNWVKWFADNKDTVLGVVGAIMGLFAASTVAKITSACATILGSAGTASLLGIASVMGYLAAGVIIAIAAVGVYQVHKEFEGLKIQIKALTDLETENKTMVEKLSKQYDDLYESGKLTEEQTKRYVKAVEGQIDTSADLINSGKLTVDQEKIEIDTLKTSIGFYKKMYDQGQLNDDQKKEYQKKLEKVIPLLEKEGENVDDLKESYKKLTGQDFSTTVEIDTKVKTDKAESKLSSFINKAGASLSYMISPSNWGDGFFKNLKSIWNSKGYAKGGIVNMPGSGVPISYSAYAGERGMEGVIPLTDSQQMALLGEAIGKYITINANITNTMNGRVISRELQKVNTSSNFANNR